MSDEYEVVERNEGPRSSKFGRAVAALLEAATTGKAVRIPLQGMERHAVQGALRNALRKHGYRLHYRIDGPDALRAWAVPIEPNGTDPSRWPRTTRPSK